MTAAFVAHQEPQDRKRRRVCVVTAGGPHPWIIINALADRFGCVTVILEESEPRGAFLARRARRQGWISVAGQFATMILIRSGKALFARRIARIEASERLETSPRPDQTTIRISSVNSAPFLRTVGEQEPDVILLVGCRIVRPDVLSSLKCPVLNYHAGITPQYRGMNGGYWALATGDRANFGATVHLVDAEVDTGAIVAQVRGEPVRDDNIMTYAYRLAAISREMCVGAVADALAGSLNSRPSAGTTRQWYHPPIWRYLWTGMTKGVW